MVIKKVNTISPLWRWSVIAVVMLVLVTIEVVEHRPRSLADLDSDFVREVLVFGVAFPLVSGIGFHLLARIGRKQAGVAPGPITAGGTKNAGTTNVLILWNEALLGGVVNSVLAQRAGLNVVQVTCDEEALADVIRQAKPDVIVLDKTMEATYLVALVDLDYPRLRIVVVNVDNNWVNVYDKKRVLMTQAADLISIVQRL
jgi:hypothetical protein